MADGLGGRPNLVLNVACRELNLKVACGSGQQDFKWLANIVKARYLQTHPEFKLEQFTPINVYSQEVPLYPSEIITNNVKDGETVYVELLGPTIGINDPNYARQKSMWELLAYTAPHNFVQLVLHFDSSDCPEFSEGSGPPAIIGNFGPHTWRVPAELTKTGEFTWEYRKEVPAYAEIVFIFVVNGVLWTSPRYEVVEDDSEQELNCIEIGAPYCNYSELYLSQNAPIVPPVVLPPATVERRKVSGRKVGKLDMFNLETDDMTEKLFRSDIKKVLAKNIFRDEKDRERTEAKLWEYYADIRSIFVKFASKSTNSPYMNQLQFMIFCAQCKLPDKEQLSKSRIMEEFHQVNREVAGTEEMDDPFNPDNAFVRFEFMEALVRLAYLKFDSQPIDVALSSLMAQIHKYIDVVEVNDFRRQLLNPQVEALLRMYDKRLWHVFNKYSTLRAHGRKHMSCADWEFMLQDLDVVGNDLSIRECKVAFGMAQQEEGHDDQVDKMELNFSEFCEALARISKVLHTTTTTPSETPEMETYVNIAEPLNKLFVMLFPQAANHRRKKKRGEVYD